MDAQQTKSFVCRLDLVLEIPMVCPIFVEFLTVEFHTVREIAPVVLEANQDVMDFKQIFSFTVENKLGDAAGGVPKERVVPA